MLYPGSRFRMADDLLDRYIQQLFEAHRSPEVAISWQGGEPMLMGLEFFRRSITCAQKYRKPGVKVEYTIQTNGTLIDDAWAEFFKEQGFLVGISIDGPEAMHDAFRKGKGGQPTFGKVMRGLSLLRKYGVEFNTLTCVHKANADHPVEVYRFLRDECGSRFIQLIPIVERVKDSAVYPLELVVSARKPGDAVDNSWLSWRDRPLYTQEGGYVTDRSVRPAQYGTFLIAMFEEWVRRDVGTVYVQMFDTALANWLNTHSGMCVHSERCGSALALEHNGDLYSCDHFVEPKHKLGNIFKAKMIELVMSPQQRKFGNDKYDMLPDYCRDCDVRFACHGGCPKDRFIAAPDGQPGLNYLCEGYKAFFSHVAAPMHAMATLLRRNRAPSEIMHSYRVRHDWTMPTS